MTSMRKQLENTAVKFLEAHNHCSLPEIEAILAPNSTHSAGPPSLKTPVRNHAEQLAWEKEVYDVLNTYHARPSNTIIDEQERKVVMKYHAHATADAGIYDNECMVVLTMTEDGKLVQDEYRFIDSITMLDWTRTLGDWATERWQTA